MNKLNKKYKKKYNLTKVKWNFLQTINNVEEFIDDELLMESILFLSTDAISHNPFEKIFEIISCVKNNDYVHFELLETLDQYYPQMHIIDFLLTIDNEGDMYTGIRSTDRGQLAKNIGKNNKCFNYQKFCLLLIEMYMSRLVDGIGDEDEVLSEVEYAELYDQIKFYNNKSISKLIDEILFDTQFELNPSDSSVRFVDRQSYYDHRLSEQTTESGGSVFLSERIYPLSWTCIKHAIKSKMQIISIIQKKQRSTQSIMDIIEILAPAIAQELSEIPTLAVVAAITIMCRRGIMNYIDGSIEDI